MLIARWPLVMQFLFIVMCSVSHNLADGYYFSPPGVSRGQLRRTLGLSELDSSNIFNELHNSKNWKPLNVNYDSKMVNEDVDLERKTTPVYQTSNGNQGFQSEGGEGYRTERVKDRQSLSSFGTEAQSPELPNYLAEIKPLRDRRSPLPSGLYSMFKSLENSEYASNQLPKNWTRDICYPDGTKGGFGSNFLTHMCKSEFSDSHGFDKNISPKWIKNARVLGVCPWEIQERELSSGTIPQTVHDLRCLCENRSCSPGGTAHCTAVKQLAPVWRRSPDPCAKPLMDLISVTVNCLCVEEPAPVAASSIDSFALVQ